MAVVGFELVIIGAIILVILFWGPSKLPEIARSLGRARKEFENASKVLKASSNIPSSEYSGFEPLPQTRRKLVLSEEENETRG